MVDGLILTAASIGDRKRIMRVRPPADSRFFVHYNWFWLYRALRDPAIRFCLVRAPPRDALVAVVAYGPFEAVDQDVASRIPGIGEIYHMVVDAKRVRRGLGKRVTLAVLDDMTKQMPGLTAVRVGHHPDNRGAAGLFGALGFVPIGEKVDHETGTRDVIRERRCGPG